MRARDYTGIIPPLLTPYTKDGEVDEAALRRLLDFVLPHVHGLYPVGTYGTGPFMTVEERKRVIEIILDHVAGRIPVVAHVGAPSAHVAVELAKHAKESGAAGVGAISPFYSPGLPEDNLYAYFAALIDAVNEEEFPVFVYNNAHYSQNTITPALLAKLAEHGLRGCKDSSFDLVNFYQYTDAVADYPDFNVIVGTEAFVVAAFDAGAIGTVCGIGNIFPELLREIYDTYEAGDRAKSIELQRRILRVRTIIKAGPTVPIMHAILGMRGIDAGFSRTPLVPVSTALAEQVREELQKIGML
ncbi:MAG: dihydrodipicolinate synthase family protein [Spirochaetota bacterium]